MVQLFDMNRKLKRTITYIILAAMLLTGLGGCATWDNFYKAFINPQQESSDIIRIAILEPLTGVDAKAASDEIAGIELANQLFPSVLGKDVELVYYDTKSNIEDLKEVTEKLTEEDISLVLGCYGNAMTIAAGDILREHFIPAIAITCTNPLITRTNPTRSQSLPRGTTTIQRPRAKSFPPDSPSFQAGTIYLSQPSIRKAPTLKRYSNRSVLPAARSYTFRKMPTHQSASWKRPKS